MKQILCFGDSNTYGLIPGTKDRYDVNTRWTGILNSNLNEYGYNVLEEGAVGRTSIFEDPVRPGLKGVDKLPGILQTSGDLDIAVIMLGTNDCKIFYGATAEVIGFGIRTVLHQIKSFRPKTKILLVSPIYLGDDVYDGFDLDFDERSVEVSKQLGDVYQSIASQEGIYFLRASDVVSPSADDREHLNVEGHARFAEAVTNKIIEISRQNSVTFGDTSRQEKEKCYEKQAV